MPASHRAPSRRFLPSVPVVCGALLALLGLPAAAQTVADNPYGLAALWSGADLVARAVLLIMLIMSMGSWYLIVTRALDQARVRRQLGALPGFWKAESVAAGIAGLAEGSPFRLVAEAGLSAAQQHTGLVAQMAPEDWITLSIQRAVDRAQSRSQDGLSFLATVGSTSPFVGLFGTVWGIYHALTAIGVAGQASIDKVAGPVGEALIMTAIGLAVAVPAVLGYNWLVRRNRLIMDEVRGFGADLLAVMLAAPRARAG
jgi:biopolymer transport protein ExbB